MGRRFFFGKPDIIGPGFVVEEEGSERTGFEEMDSGRTCSEDEDSGTAEDIADWLMVFSVILGKRGKRLVVARIG